jgi:hypothetical protein
LKAEVKLKLKIGLLLPCTTSIPSIDQVDFTLRGIRIIHEFRYPIEKARINQGYNKFVDWGLNQGSVSKDWYGDNPGYRNTNKLYFNN